MEQQDKKNICKTVFHVKEMDCPSEENLVRMKLQTFDNEISELDFDLSKRQVFITHDRNAMEQIVKSMDELDLGATVLNSETVDLINNEATTNLQQKNVLVKVLVVNALFFLFEMTVGLVSQSMGLIADSLDMLADAAVYGMSLFVVGAAVTKKKRVALFSGIIQTMLALAGMVEVVRRFFFTETVPNFSAMIWMSALALLANVYCLWLLERSKSSDAHMQASMIFSANDVIVNFGVILSGLAVWYFNNRIPDLIIGTIVFVIVMRGAIRILKLSR